MCRGSIRSDQYQFARLLQREHVVHVLQKHDTGRIALPYELSVVILYFYICSFVASSRGALKFVAGYFC
jgi:hypothetical protein